MEQETLLELISMGREAWNQWREKNSAVEVNLSGCDLSNRNLSGFDFSQANLSYCNLAKSDLTESNLISANLRHANLSFANLEKANLIAADLVNADLTLAHIKGAKLLTAQLTGANFSYVDFSGHSLQGMDFRQSKLCGANLRHQDLSAMNLAETDLSQADLTGASLEDCNLQGANLARAILDDAIFDSAYLKEVNLSFTNLSGKDLHQLNLSGANLEQVDLRNASLENACLDNAILTGAKLYNVKTSGWSVKNIRCDSAYWDIEGLVATRYRAKEFERLYSASIVIDLKYDKYIAPHELTSLPIFVEHLEARHWGIKLRVKSIDEEAGGSRVKIVVQDTGGYDPELLEQQLKEEASQLVAAQMVMRQDKRLLAEFRESISQLKNHFWPQLLELAADSETGQTRLFTVMLMDLTGFSRWKGDELQEKLSLFRGLIKPILKRWKASYPNMEGDSLRATFQNASVGVACACMIRNVLQAAGFPCRIGIDLGEVTLQHNEVTDQTDLSGEAVNFAARLESHCEPGEVLVSERVWHYARQQEEYFAFSPRSVRLNKGVGHLKAGEQIHCYRVEMIKTLV